MAEGVDVSSLGPDLVEKLRRSDPEALRDFLDACGADRQVIRSLVASVIGYKFQAEKIKMILASQRGAWWKGEPDWWQVPGRAEIDRRENAEIARVVGAYPELEYPWRKERWNFIPMEKRIVIETIGQDYAELIDKLPPRPWLANEEDMYRQLRVEERRDLESLLSKAELVEYDFRNDAQSLNRDFEKYSPNEAELRAVYQAQQERSRAEKALIAKYPGEAVADPFASPLSRNPEAVAEEKVMQDAYQRRLLEIFGAERIERGDREANENFRSIVAVVDKFKVERAQADAIYAMLNQTSAELNASETRSGTSEEYEIKKAARRLEMIEEIQGRLPPSAVDLLLKDLKWQYYWLKEP
jgi:hypothetical protein